MKKILPIWTADAQPAIRRETLKIPGLAPGLAGKRILFLSDVHMGRGFSEAAFELLLERIEAESPDLILWGGDHAEPLSMQAPFYLRAARLRAPLGSFAVPGNNDYECFEGDYAPLRRMCKSAGIHLLVNKRFELPVEGGRLIIAGVDDAKHGQPRPVLRLSARPGDLRILLSHSPAALSRALEGCRALPQLALCGHTHAGQVRFLGLSPYSLGYEHRQQALERYFFERGLHEVDGMRILVSGGIGYSLIPLRIFAPPEMHLISIE